MSDLYFGPSYPSVLIMPSPTKWDSQPVEEVTVNVLADGTTVTHSTGNIFWEFDGEWDELTIAQVNSLLTDFKRTRKQALIDMDGSSYTVKVTPKSVRLSHLPGKVPTLYNLSMHFKQLTQ